MPSAMPSLKSARELHDYAKNGHSSVIGYADEFSRLSKSETHEAIRVANALADLPKLFHAFTEGDMS